MAGEVGSDADITIAAQEPRPPIVVALAAPHAALTHTHASVSPVSADGARIVVTQTVGDVRRVVRRARASGRVVDGLVSVVLAQYLTELGFSPFQRRRDRDGHADRVGRAHAGCRPGGRAALAAPAAARRVAC